MRARIGLRVVALVWLGLLLVAPVVMIVVRTFSSGLAFRRAYVRDCSTGHTPCRVNASSSSAGREIAASQPRMEGVISRKPVAQP